MSLSDYQLSIGTTGLVIGAGTDYIVHQWDGAGLPGVRDSDQPRPFAHGNFLGPEFIEARQVVIDLTVRGDDAADCQANIDSLVKAWYFDARPVSSYDQIVDLSVKVPGQAERFLKGRPRKLEIDTSNLKSGKATASLEFVAGDPRWYSYVLRSATLNVTAPASGRGYNRSFDYGYGGGSSSAVSAVNAGSISTPPSMTVYGPLTNVTVTNETTDQSITITYTLASGEFLDLDFAERTVLLNGTASRYYAMTGDWWDLAPGTNTLRMTANSGTGTVAVSWRDTWL